MKSILITLTTMLLMSEAMAAKKELVFEEKDGQVVVEAEHYAKQEKDNIRKWYLVDKDHQPKINPDGDDVHYESASGKTYLEILPDTRRTHDDKLIRGENFTNNPGEIAVLNYNVHFNTTGKYYIWVRAYSTTTEDNGLHVGIDGEWPSSGQRLQWCAGKNTWKWESKQRTEEEHCGVPHLIFIDVKEPGLHTISFSMREDGFEFDQWMMTLDREFIPEDKAMKASNSFK